jgi:hypothetical protein
MIWAPVLGIVRSAEGAADGEFACIPFSFLINASGLYRSTGILPVIRNPWALAPMLLGSLLVIPADCDVCGPPGNQSFLPLKNNRLARRYVPCRNAITIPTIWDGPGCAATILANTSKLIANPTPVVNGFAVFGGPIITPTRKNTAKNRAE